MLSEWTQNEEEVLTSHAGNRVARLIPSVEGPKLLINREEYALQEACWDVEMFHGKNGSILIFYWKGEVKLSVKIAPLSSQFESFLMKLYQYLNFKTRAVQSI